MDKVLEVQAVKPIEVLGFPVHISVIIPTYNKIDYLIECCRSIIRYTNLGNVEVIVVANGCTDDIQGYVGTLGPHFKVISFPEPLGYTKATNEGIKVAQGDYVVLMNNDTVLLEQPMNQWLEILLAPFNKGPKVGVTGPVKFHWKLGETDRSAIAFWLAMIPRRLFTELGLLDEIFNPGMGEDGDFCIKAETSGYKLVAVPKDVSEEFGKGIPHQDFPIFHHGSGTFREKDYSDVKKRNDGILLQRYGKKSKIEEIYQICHAHPSDVNALFPTLRHYAEQCQHITEFGTRGVVTTYAFLAAKPKRVVSYDIEYEPFAHNIEYAKWEAGKAGISYDFHKQDVLQADIEPTDFLFIDTLHTYLQLKTELERHSGKVAKFIACHDTETFGLIGQDGGPGEKRAIAEFLASHLEWKQKEHITISNGLTILERFSPTPRSITRAEYTGNSGFPGVKEPFDPGIHTSIIIPTCGKDWKNVLRVCLERVFQATDMEQKEIIVVANGAPQDALDFLSQQKVRVLTYPEPIGYIRAVNAGIKEARGMMIVLLDDDSILNGQPHNQWIQMLLAPFMEDPKMGATGAFAVTYPDLGDVVHSGCTMYKAAVLREIGGFDEIFNPGYMSDEDVALRIRKAGYNITEVPRGQEKPYVDGTFQIAFPVVHTGHVATMPKWGKDLPIVAKNREILLKRHAAGASDGFRSKKEFDGHVAVMPAPKPKVSIVIPTAFDKLETILKPNLQSMIEFTDLTDLEVIVVANGCTDDTVGYVNSLGPPFKVISFPDAMGFTRATNEGLKIAQGEFIVLYNNDNILLPQPKHRWMNQLLEPFKDNPKMGITGPLQLHDDYANQDVIIGFCLCISRVVMQEAMADTGGLLDEIFSPGGGEDIDLCCKVRAKGYVVRQVPHEGKLGYGHTNEGDFMICHVNNQTFKDIESYTRYTVKKNGWINCKRYNRDIRLNLGSGGVPHKGYLSVDLYDRRADIIQDISELDFEENSVSDIIAIHVFEHLNPYKSIQTLKNWLRILKPGGRLMMEMPNIEEVCRQYLAANQSQRYGLLNVMYGSVNTQEGGEQSDITSPHLYGWDPQTMSDHLHEAGFTGIKLGEEQFPHPPPNFHIEAFKPD